MRSRWLDWFYRLKLFWHGIQTLFLPTAIKGFTQVWKQNVRIKSWRTSFLIFLKRQHKLFHQLPRKPLQSANRMDFHLSPLIKPRTSLLTILQYPKLSEPSASKQKHYIFHLTAQNPKTTITRHILLNILC